jgi:hypothetical protein
VSKSSHVSKSLSSVLAGLMLLLVQVGSSSADTPPTDQGLGARNHDSAAGRAPMGEGYASEVPREDIIDRDQSTLAADKGEQSIPVAEEIEFVTGNSFRKPFEESLKTVAKVDYYGTRYVGCESYPLQVHTARPDQVSLQMKTGNSSKFEGSKSSRGIKVHGTPLGLKAEQQRALLATFDFDTPIIELENNPNAFKPLGMEKLPGILTWKLQVERSGGYTQIVYVDSHFGDIVKLTIVNAQGAHILDVAPHDYRDVDGIRVPFAIDYRSPDGTVLANDRFERVEVKRTRS